MEAERCTDSTTADVVAGVLAAIVFLLLAIAYTIYRREKKHKMRAVDFQAELEKLMEEGKISQEQAAAAGIGLPREIKRKCTWLLGSIFAIFALVWGSWMRLTG